MKLSARLFLLFLAACACGGFVALVIVALSAIGLLLLL
jgi:hypothetical protein